MKNSYGKTIFDKSGRDTPAKRMMIGLAASGLLVLAATGGASAAGKDYGHRSHGRDYHGSLYYNHGFVLHSYDKYRDDKVFAKHARNGFKDVSYAPWSDNWYRACAIKYDGFDPETGYVETGGKRRFCKI